MARPENIYGLMEIKTFPLANHHLAIAMDYPPAVSTFKTFE